MKKLAIAVTVLTVVAVAALAWAPRTVAAQDARLLRRAEPQVHVMAGGGSSIGVTVRDVTADDAQKAKLGGASGVFIETVREGTPAARAGLRSGDIVLEFDGERVRSVQQFQRLVSESAPGRVARAVVARDGSRQTVDVTPERRDALELFSRNERLPRLFSFDVDNLAPEIRTLVSPRQLGATLTPLSEQLETYFGVSNGVLVSNVAADTPASAGGLRAGDVITQINGRRVDAPGDVAQAVRNAEAGAQLEIVVMRDRKEVKLTAKVPERGSPLGRRGVTL